MEEKVTVSKRYLKTLELFVEFSIPFALAGLYFLGMILYSIL